MATEVEAVSANASDVMETTLRSIAREIALDLLELDVILRNHGIDDGEWERIARLPRFQMMLRQERELWSSSLNVDERIILKSKIMVENTMERMYEFMMDPAHSHAARVGLLKEWRTIGNLGAKVDGQAAQGAGEKFVLQINMGTQTVSIEGAVAPQGNLIEGEIIRDEASAIRDVQPAPVRTEDTFNAGS